MILNEQQLVQSLVTDLYNEHIVWFEVPNMGQSADVVVDRNGTLTFIEVKIKDWAKAIKQCKAHEIVADYIYIAVATRSIPENLINEARINGYGVIHYNWTCECWKYVIESPKNFKVWMPQRQILNNKLKKMSYAC